MSMPKRAPSEIMDPLKLRIIFQSPTDSGLELGTQKGRNWRSES
ncbi:hypothetical protein T4A_2225 [Trichinella pseudospiralis]|uniref:Uncharacterized protein n=1 Tax=Trichinella pseudospiralis TaxID=6337 RepID=A0A0V1DPX6_TRIPS|nr:hypothetical protein T4A_2225 [Trichinella pseudospiralis]